MTDDDDAKSEAASDLAPKVEKLSDLFEGAILRLDELKLPRSTLDFLASPHLGDLLEPFSLGDVSLQLPDIQISNLLADNHISPFLAQIETLKSSLLSSFEGLIPPGLIDLEDLSEEVQAAALALGRAGWYIDMNRHSVEESVELAAQLAEGKIGEVNTRLTEHYEQHQGEIVADLVDMFQPRASIIERAFQAHGQRWYELSIPVMLAQVDGICRDKTQYYLFMGSTKGEPETAKYVKDVATSAFEKALLAPFGHKLPINMNAKERGTEFVGLNRHLVLHGESLDYATQVNSCKAISLLDYAGHALQSTNT